MSELAPTAVVTGGSRGIGKGIVKTLARKGWQVYFTYNREQGLAREVEEEVAADGGSAFGFSLDVSDDEQVKAFFQNNVKSKVSLDLLVNNAGITKDGLLLRMKKEDWKQVQRVNLDGAFFCLQEAAKIMIKQRRGRIVNISSLVAESGNPGQANYCSSKAGIIGLTKSAAQELGSRGITVNAVSPGFIRTEMTDDLDEETQGKYLERIPLGRFGESEDVAETVAWLASGEAGYITGQVIGVNGGMYM